MPQDGLFFRVLRRFNILWIAILGLLLIASCGYHLYKDAHLRHHFLSHIVKVEKAGPAVAPAADISVTTDNYGSADTHYGPWNGKVFVQMRSFAPPDPASPESFKDYVPPQVTNVMVTDAKTGEGTWLFPAGNQIIRSRDAVYEGEAKTQADAASDPRPIVGMVMLVSDIDKAGKPAAKCGCTMYVWTKGSTKPVKLFAADAVQTFGQMGADRYVIQYQKGKEMRIATYAVPGFKQISDKAMPDAPK